MTVADIRNDVRKKYSLGQVVAIRIKENEREEAVKHKCIILGFYNSNVLVERNGLKESYRYWDFMRMTSEIKKEKSDNVKAGHHKSKAAS